LVDRRLKTHDANQLQLKLGYTVEPGVKRHRYLVESYMFVPRTLGVGGHVYGPAQFYEDTQTFVRLRTPAVALEALAKPGRAERWFDPVRAGLDALLGGGSAPLADLMRSVKLLGCIYQSAIREEARLLLDRFDALDVAPKGALEMQEAELARSLGVFVDHLEAAIERLRRAGRRCEHAVIPDDVRVAWAVVDEFTALYAEELVTSLVAGCDVRRRARADTPLREVRARLADVAVAQYHYRRSRNYPSYLVPGATNEAIPWRRRILKRILHSALFLDIRHEEGGTVQRDLIAGVAAAAAMLFAVLVAIWAQLEWGIFSSTFVIIAVISYIVKDRIKEWGRRYLGRRLARWLPDYVVRVRDPHTGRVLGQSRESVTVVDPSRVDPAIVALRHADHPSSVAQHGRAEAVIRFVKEVTLDSKGLEAALSGADGLNDIIRFNFARFRQRMDKPIETYKVVHPEEKRIISVPCNRIYHINLVLRFTQGSGDESSVRSERVRVIIDQKGLKRVEMVGAFTHGLADQVTGATLGAPAHPAVAPPGVVVIDDENTEHALATSL